MGRGIVSLNSTLTYSKFMQLKWPWVLYHTGLKCPPVIISFPGVIACEQPKTEYCHGQNNSLQTLCAAFSFCPHLEYKFPFPHVFNSLSIIKKNLSLINSSSVEGIQKKIVSFSLQLLKSIEWRLEGLVTYEISPQSLHRY